MRKIKIGIIGCGCIARSGHIPEYLANGGAQIAYFCDSKLESAESCVSDYGCGIAVDDYRTVLLDPDVDAVSVCTPNLMHGIVSIEAMRSGKHVLCEKPAAKTYEEALEMQRVHRETGKIMNIGMVCRFNRSVNRVRSRIAAGELGEIYHVFVNFRAFRSIPGIGGAFTNRSISGGGVLIDWGVHRLDQVMYCLGDPKPLTVSAQTFSKLGLDMENYKYRSMWSESTKNTSGVYDVEDSVCALIRTEGPVITLEGAWAQNIDEEEQYLDFLGTKGGIRLFYGGGYRFYTVRNGQFCTEEENLSSDDMYQMQIDSFLECIRTGNGDRNCIDNVILTSEIMQAVYDSSERGREVVLS